MDSFKLINDFLTFNGRLEKKPFIRRYLIVFLLTYALMTIGRAINMPLLVSSIVRLCYSADVAGGKALP